MKREKERQRKTVTHREEEGKRDNQRKKNKDSKKDEMKARKREKLKERDRDKHVFLIYEDDLLGKYIISEFRIFFRFKNISCKVIYFFHGERKKFNNEDDFKTLQTEHL